MGDDIPEIDLEALDRYLMSDQSPDDCMMLSDLDGFLTGVVVGPEFIPPSEWLPVIWGRGEPGFESDDQMQTIFGTIFGRYNEIVDIMNTDPDAFEPILEQWPNGDLIVADWAAGFLDAVKLRQKAWQPLFKHPHAKLLVEPLVILGDVEDHFERSATDSERRFYASKPRVIPICVAGIYDFWRDCQRGQRPKPRRPRGGRRKP